MSDQPLLFAEEPRAPGEVRITDPWPADLPWPGKLPARYSFTPEAVTAAKKLIEQVADALLVDRPDIAFLRPKLILTMTVELNDFVRYNQTDASEGFESVEAMEAAAARRMQGMQAWPAQPQGGRE